jgi:hypothetical protein
VKRKLIHILGFSLSIKVQGNRGSACLLALVLAGAVPSFANTLTVTNTNDSGPGSLRDAIAAANAGDRIEFTVTGTITLTSGSLTVDKNLTIQGTGATQLTIEGADGPVPMLSVGTHNSSAVIAISGLTIHAGAFPSGEYLAVIINHAILTMTECSVLGTSNQFGASSDISNAGTLTLVNSTVSGNATWDGAGGGIFNSGTLTLMNSTVSGNTVINGNGGGVDNIGTLKMTNSTVSSNVGFVGGGISNSGTLTLTNSAVSENSTLIPSGFGGGIYNESESALTLINSTVAGNSTAFGGGGIYNDGGTLSVTNSTIADNSSGFPVGGGISNVGTFTIKSSLVANNGPAGNCDFSAGPAASLGYNVSDDDTCTSSFTAIGDENNVIPGAGLDPKGLQNNGGPTQTFALLPGSPSVDHIPVADCTDASGNPVKTDQRGIKRPQGPACDTGAFELVQTVPFSNFTASLAIQTGHDPSFGLTARFTLGAGSDGIAPLTQPVTLQIANYSVEIPAGSFHPLWNSPSAPYIYEGTINGTKLVVGVIPLGGNNYEFSAVGSPVSWVNVTNPVTVSLTVGNDGGSTPVRAFIGNH